jgi:hypothetical protein
MRTAPLILLLSLCACAGEETPTERPGRAALLDAAGLPIDATTLDRGLLPYDAGLPDAALEPGTRPVWLVVRHEAPSAGLRAALDPPQTPAPLALPANIGRLVIWQGPGSPGEAVLEARTARRPASAFYDLAHRVAQAPDAAATVAADARWLAAHHLDDRSLQLDGRPLLVVAGALEVPQAWAQLRAHLRDALPEPPAIALEIDPNAAPQAPDGVHALLPAVAHGYSTAGAPQGSDADAARLARWRGAARAVGLRWLPVARGPTNRRLDAPTAAIEPPGVAGFTRSVVLARRAAEPDLGTLVIDGLGGWRDDRQLDPLQGPEATAPEAITGSHRYTTSAPLTVLAALLRAPAGDPPADLAQGVPVQLFRAAGVDASTRIIDAALEVSWVDAAGGTGRRLELLLDARPWRVPAGARLHYRRSSDALALDLVFADGTRLLGVLGRPPSGAEVVLPLDAFAGRRVEDLAVVLFGGDGPRGSARIEEIGIAR